MSTNRQRRFNRPSLPVHLIFSTRPHTVLPLIGTNQGIGANWNKLRSLAKQKPRQNSKERRLMLPATPHRIDPPNFFGLGGRWDSPPIVPPLEASEERDDFASAAAKHPPLRQHADIGSVVAESLGAEVLRRIDDPHPVAERDRLDEVRTSRQWQQDHLIDLFDQLQRWAAELDERETQLASQSILEDHCRRRIRLGRLRRHSQREGRQPSADPSRSSQA